MLTLHHAGGDAVRDSGDLHLPAQRDARATAASAWPSPSINSYLQEHITGIAVLQLFNREQPQRARIRRRQSRAHGRVQGRHHRVRLVLPGGGVHLHAGAGRHSELRRLPRASAAALTLGVVVAFLQYGLRFFRPIQDLSEKYNILQSAMASSERIFKLLDTPGDDSRRQSRPPNRRRAIATHRIRPRLVRLQGRRLGAARRELHHRARARPSRWWATPARARPR